MSISIPHSLQSLLRSIGIHNLKEFTSTYISVGITPTKDQQIKSTFERVEKVCQEIPIEVEEESKEVEEATLTRSYSIGSPYALAQGKYACCAYMSNNKIIISIFRKLINNPTCERLLQSKYDITQQPVIDFLNWWVSVDIIIRLLTQGCSKEKISVFVNGMIELYITTEFYKRSAYVAENPFSNPIIIENCIFYLGLIIFIYYLTWSKFKPIRCLTIRTRTFTLESSLQYQLLLQLFTFKNIDSLVEGFDCPDMVEDIEFFLNIIKKCTPTNIVCCPFNIKYDFDEGCFVIIFWNYTSESTVKAYITVDDVLQIVDYCVNVQHTYVEFATELDNFKLFENTPNPTVHSVNIKEFNITRDEAGIGNSWGIHNPYFYIKLRLTILTTIAKGNHQHPQHLELNGVSMMNRSGPPEIYKKIIGLSQTSLEKQKQYAKMGIIEELKQLPQLQAEAERLQQEEAEQLQQAEAERLQEEEAERQRQRQQQEEEAERQRQRQEAERQRQRQQQEEEEVERQRQRQQQEEEVEAIKQLQQQLDKQQQTKQNPLAITGLKPFPIGRDKPNNKSKGKGKSTKRGGSKSKKIKRRKTIKRRKRRTKRKHSKRRN